MPESGLKATITKLFLLNVAMIFVVYSIFPDLQGSLTLLKLRPEQKWLVIGLWIFAIVFTLGIAYYMAKEGELVGV